LSTVHVLRLRFLNAPLIVGQRPIRGGVRSPSFAPEGHCDRHRFGSALNDHVHLHACVTDGVFMPPAAGSANDAPPRFLQARPITQGELAAVTERVRHRLIRWFRRTWPALEILIQAV
jgi:hypothetical protein